MADVNRERQEIESVLDILRARIQGEGLGGAQIDALLEAFRQIGYTGGPAALRQAIAQLAAGPVHEENNGNDEEENDEEENEQQQGGGRRRRMSVRKHRSTRYKRRSHRHGRKTHRRRASRH